MLSPRTFSTGLLTSTDNQLYFPSVSGGSSNTATVVYLFMSRCTNIATVAAPFSDQKSGGPLKYTDNYSTAVTVISMPAATNAFTIASPPTRPFCLQVAPSPTPSP